VAASSLPPCSIRAACRKGELNHLYQRRWNVELDVRNIKATLGMEVLRCRTPVMAQKVVWVHLLEYNLIRLLIAQAAFTAGVHPRELSFNMRCRSGSSGPLAFRVLTQNGAGNSVPTDRPAASGKPARTIRTSCAQATAQIQWLKVPRRRARRQIHLHGYLPNASASASA